MERGPEVRNPAENCKAILVRRSHERRDDRTRLRKFIERMAQEADRQMVGSLSGCVHCGMCTESCHYVLANPDDPTYAPAYKADQIRKIFKRNFDWTGQVFPWWVHAKSISHR